MTAPAAPSRPHPGEPLALDLVNTQWVTRAGPQDALCTPGAVRAWLEEQQLWTPELDPAQVQRDLFAARTALRRFLERPSDEPARQHLNALLERGVTVDALEPGGPAQHVRVSAQDRPAWMVVHNLLELLRIAPARVKRCANPECVLYFYDTSPKNARRWHDMKVCGNRVKAARHYQRRKHPEHT